MYKHLPEISRCSETLHSAWGDAPCIEEVGMSHSHKQEEENQMQAQLVGVCFRKDQINLKTNPEGTLRPSCSETIIKDPSYWDLNMLNLFPWKISMWERWIVRILVNASRRKEIWILARPHPKLLQSK